MKNRLWVWAFAIESNVSWDKPTRYENRQYFRDRENFENDVYRWPWAKFYQDDGQREDFLIPAVEKSGEWKWTEF
jgi:hypothetical protein